MFSSDVFYVTHETDMNETHIIVKIYKRGLNSQASSSAHPLLISLAVVCLKYQ